MSTDSNIIAVTAAVVVSDRNALSIAAAEKAGAEGRDALRDRNVTTPAHHARVVQKWADMSEAGTTLAASMANDATTAAHVFNNLEAHGKNWLRSVIECAATGRKCENSVMDVLVHVLQGVTEGRTVFETDELKKAARNNNSRVASAVRAYFRAYSAATLSTRSMEVNGTAPFVVALAGAMTDRGMIVPTAPTKSRKRKSDGE